MALKGPLESGEIEPVRSFFTSEEEGYWKDFSAAGYLLANAFRRNSSAAPDTLPAVKVRIRKHCLISPSKIVSKGFPQYVK